MPFFESAEEKAVRLDVERNMDICLSNPKNYETARMMLTSHLRKCQQWVIETMVDHIKATIKDDDFQPVRKYQAMLLLKDLMLTHNKPLGKYVVKKILKRLVIFAQHKCGEKEMEREDDRARDIFGTVKRDQEKYATMFFNTLLMALEEWGKNWPRAPDGPHKDFHEVYNDLLMNNVRFPKQRPKEVSRESISPYRAGSKEEKRPSVSKKPSQPVPSKAPTKPQPRKSSLSQSLQASLISFYQQLKQPLNFLQQVLPSITHQDVGVIDDIVRGIREPMEKKGDEFMIQAEQQNAQDEVTKIQELFKFLEAVSNDLRIVKKSKKQFDTFVSKYTKKTKRILALINNEVSQVREKTPSKMETSVTPRASSIIKPPTDEPSKSKIEGSQIEKKEEPVIKQNRFSSVQGNQAIEIFNQVKEFNSNNGDSVHSDKFGSFGGPPAATERHKASIPGQVTPDRTKAQSERKSSEVKKNTGQPEPIHEERPSVTGKPPAPQPQPQKQPSVDPFALQPSVQPQQRPSDPPNNPFKKDSDSFGGNFEGIAKVPTNEEEPDFFAMQEKKEEDLHKVAQNSRRKKVEKVEPAKEAAPTDWFQDNSRVSGGLSGFDFSQKGIEPKDSLEPKSSLTPRQVSQPIAGSEREVKKSVGFDNPFGLDGSMSKSQQSQNKSNFFDYFPKPDPKEDPLSKSDLSNFKKSNVFELERSGTGEPESKYPTGHFGNMVAEVKQKSPYDVESVGSRRENPFNNDSFERVSKRSQQSGGSQRESPFEQSNPFASRGPVQRDPFASKEPTESGDPFASRVPPSQQDPFENSTHKSQKSNKSSNPFESRGVEIDKGPYNSRIPNSATGDPFASRVPGMTGDPFDSRIPPSVGDPFDSRAGVSDQNDPFKSSNGGDESGPNPFETSTHKSSRSGNPFEQSSGNRVPGLPQPGMFKKADKGKVVEASAEYFPPNQPVRDSLGLSPHLQGPENDSVHFSQFGDIGEGRSSAEEKKQNQSFSGFSLSQFPGMGQSNNNLPGLQAGGQSVTDFFGQFEKRSTHSKASQKQKDSGDVFEAWNIDRSSKKEKSQKKSAGQRNVVEREKTVNSHSQNSFDFGQLEKASAIQSKNNLKRTDSAIMDRQDGHNRPEDGQNSSRSHKDLSWGDFDIPSNFEKPEGGAGSPPMSDDRKNGFLQGVPSNQQLGMESKLDLPVRSDRKLPQTDRSKGQPSQQPSIDIKFEDFSPLAKKGIEWNPLAKIAKLKENSGCTYLVDMKKVEGKKEELAYTRQQYEQRLQEFKENKMRSDQVRGEVMGRLKKSEEAIGQRKEYEIMLSRLRERNDEKEKRISGLHARLKKVEELKSRLLQKEKHLFDLTKNQQQHSRQEDRSAPAQRSLAAKWELFNKSLSHQRNSAMTGHTRNSLHY